MVRMDGVVYKIMSCVGGVFFFGRRIGYSSSDGVLGMVTVELFWASYTTSLGSFQRCSDSLVNVSIT